MAVKEKYSTFPYRQIVIPKGRSKFVVRGSNFNLEVKASVASDIARKLFLVVNATTIVVHITLIDSKYPPLKFAHMMRLDKKIKIKNEKVKPQI